MKKKTKLVAGALLAIMLLAGKYIHDQCFIAVEKKIDLVSPKVNSDIKITHISDFHSNVISNLDELLENIKNFKPELLILTGDMIDYPTEPKIKRTMYFLKKLVALDIKTYFVSGNHEEASIDSEIFYKKLEELGINKLTNDGEFLKIKDNNIYIYGTSYYGFDLSNFKGTDDSLNIVLSHFSKQVREAYNDKIDFVFSGHTHGGQVRAPFIGALVAPGEGYLPEYDMGIFPYKNSQIYIESGLGNTFLPLRFLNPISYSNITIKNKRL